MTYRDDREALRGRVSQLESELDQARGEIDRARVLERQLAEARQKIALLQPQHEQGDAHHERTHGPEIQEHHRQVMARLTARRELRRQQAESLEHLPQSDISSLPTSEFGGFWVRVLAALIDSVIIGALSGALASQEMTLGLASGTLAAAAYGIAAPVLWGGHVGKLVFGYRIVTADGRRLTWQSSALRYVATLLSAFACSLGNLAVAFSDRKQGWHDRLAGTYVVRAHHQRG